MARSIGFRGREKYMEMIGHHDKFMKKELLLTTVLKERVEEQESHPVALKHAAASPGCRGDEICIRSE